MRRKDAFDFVTSAVAVAGDALAVFGGFLSATWIRFDSGWIPLLLDRQPPHLYLMYGEGSGRRHVGVSLPVQVLGALFAAAGRGLQQRNSAAGPGRGVGHFSDHGARVCLEARGVSSVFTPYRPDLALHHCGAAPGRTRRTISDGNPCGAAEGAGQPGIDPRRRSGSGPPGSRPWRTSRGFGPRSWGSSERMPPIPILACRRTRSAAIGAP